MRRLLILPVLSAVILVASAAPAPAVSAGTTTFVGGGNVSPGLTAALGTHAWSNVVLNGQWVGLKANWFSVFLPFSCGLSWSTTVSGTENLAVGVGHGTFNCTSGVHGWTGAVKVTRVGTVAEIAFVPSIGGLVGSATCVLVPSPVPSGVPGPITAFTFVCSAWGSSFSP